MIVIKTAKETARFLSFIFFYIIILVNRVFIGKRSKSPETYNNRAKSVRREIKHNNRHRRKSRGWNRWKIKTNQKEKQLSAATKPHIIMLSSEAFRPAVISKRDFRGFSRDACTQINTCKTYCCVARENSVISTVGRVWRGDGEYVLADCHCDVSVWRRNNVHRFHYTPRPFQWTCLAHRSTCRYTFYVRRVQKAFRFLIQKMLETRNG